MTNNKKCVFSKRISSLKCFSVISRLFPSIFSNIFFWFCWKIKNSLIFHWWFLFFSLFVDLCSPGQQLEVWDIRRVLNNIFYHWLNQNLCFEHPLFSLSFFQKIMFFVFFFVVEAKMTFHHQIQKEDISKNNLKKIAETKWINKTNYK